MLKRVRRRDGGPSRNAPDGRPAIEPIGDEPDATDRANASSGRVATAPRHPHEPTPLVFAVARPHRTFVPPRRPRAPALSATIAAGVVTSLLIVHVALEGGGAGSATAMLGDARPGGDGLDVAVAWTGGQSATGARVAEGPMAGHAPSATGTDGARTNEASVGPPRDASAVHRPAVEASEAAADAAPDALSGTGSASTQAGAPNGTETDATDTADATDVTDATDTTDATDASGVTDATRASDATDATDASDVTDASDATDTPDATDATDASDATDATDTPDAIDATDETDAMDATDLTDGTDAPARGRAMAPAVGQGGETVAAMGEAGEERAANEPTLPTAPLRLAARAPRPEAITLSTAPPPTLPVRRDGAAERGGRPDADDGAVDGENGVGTDDRRAPVVRAVASGRASEAEVRWSTDAAPDAIEPERPERSVPPQGVAGARFDLPSVAATDPAEPPVRGPTFSARHIGVVPLGSEGDVRRFALPASVEAVVRQGDRRVFEAAERDRDRRAGEIVYAREFGEAFVYTGVDPTVVPSGYYVLGLRSGERAASVRLRFPASATAGAAPPVRAIVDEVACSAQLGSAALPCRRR